jgi:large subunit ribosomal protein L13
MTTSNLKTIDATNMKLGRVASQAAASLMGKDSVAFARHILTDVKVEVINAGKLNVDDTKKRTKIYTRYSGYPGGQRQLTLEKISEKKGMKEAVRIAVRGMLPPNKLRAKMLKNLTITD